MDTTLLTAGDWLARLGWALLHFLWQGALIGLLFAMTLPLLRHASSQARYVVSLGFLSLLGACPPLTFWLLGNGGIVGGSATPLAAVMTGVVTPQLAAGNPQGGVADALGWLGLLVPWLVPAWAVGVILLSTRLFGDWYRVRAVVADAQPVADDPWADIVARVARRVGLKRAVRLLESLAIEVPVVVGWLRPVILVPSSVLMGLEPRQLELILVHELAHVRRGDYIVNLVQVAIETLLFYHPVVRWISNRVRHERENCCDDLVVRTSFDRLAYARALLELDGLRGLAASAAVSSTGGNLAVRIRRIIGMPAPQRGVADWLAGVALTAVGVATLGLGQLDEPPAVDAAPHATTLHEFDIATRRLAVVTDPVVTSSTHGRPRARNDDAQRQHRAEPRRQHVPTATIATAAKSGSGVIATTTRAGLPPDGRSAGRAPDVTRAEASAAPGPAVQQAAPIAMRETAATLAAASPATRDSDGSTVRLREVAIDVAPLASVASAAAMDPSSDQGDAAGHGPMIETSGSATAEAPLPHVTGGQPLRLVAPEFPASARHLGHEGYVVIAYTIGKNGRTRDVEVLDVGPRDYFSRAALRAVREWRFEPVRVDGVAIEKRMTQRFSFVLDGSEPVDPDQCVLLTGSRLCR